MGMCTNASVTDLLSRREERMCAACREFGLGLCVASAVQVTGRVGGQLTKLNRGLFLLKPNLNEALSAVLVLVVFQSPLLG